MDAGLASYIPWRLTADPSSWPGRTTSSGVLLHGRKLLLERRPDNAPVTPGVWDTPGGHLRPGEAPEAALIRELGEELGIQIREFRLAAALDVREEPLGIIYRHFVFIVDGWDGEVGAAEGQSLAWMDIAEARARSDLAPATAWVLRLIAANGWAGALRDTPSRGPGRVP